MDETEHRRRAIAHLKSAVRYERKDLRAKARAHFGRAMHYGFGAKQSELPDELIEIIVRYAMEGSTEVSANWLAFPVKVDVTEFLKMSAEERHKHIFYPFYIRTVHATARKPTYELLDAYMSLNKRSDSNTIAAALTNLRIMIVEYWHHMCPYRFHDLVDILHRKDTPPVIKQLCMTLLGAFVSHLDDIEACEDCKILKRDETKRQIRDIIAGTFKPAAVHTSEHKIWSFVQEYEKDLAHNKAAYGDLCVWKTGGVIDMMSIFQNRQWNEREWDVRLWDTRSVNYMGRSFDSCRGSLRGVECWCVTSVTIIEHMFTAASSFNRDISEWDTRSVCHMGGMFEDARSFNRDISNWDTSKVADMTFMFRRALAFEQSLSRWDTSRLHHWYHWNGMFDGATAMNMKEENKPHIARVGAV